eukprot:Sspe_Gene.34917::Locus_16955_Transcript_2_5_Confidence_0.286_Length_804::g.34917::m.34917
MSLSELYSEHYRRKLRIWISSMYEWSAGLSRRALVIARDVAQESLNVVGKGQQRRGSATPARSSRLQETCWERWMTTIGLRRRVIRRRKKRDEKHLADLEAELESLKQLVGNFQDIPSSAIPSSSVGWSSEAPPVCVFPTATKDLDRIESSQRGSTTSSNVPPPMPHACLESRGGSLFDVDVEGSTPLLRHRREAPRGEQDAIAF